ncbi:aldehyde dehydrogenase family protein [Sulfolobus acidocaldarius]|uniref:aldehyde dehydrogenase (NAD(+)) n=4 Tax=Sulfolobus acidocaldarius TaxID=2285 RepID=Q4J9S9_SULAC|nr:aldehyde dehydrogenase family protein [Sulfolobus acidocaldarius]AAY80451.1 aldehyde dehydrogenase [Sulfolobus acidocaldarius DSM 639]AGE73307.1 aldehyde dehydrogenase [Sulfolobus acidocaldarius Ron12/I]ALU28672.1 aldehyde dehydrogenase [Sulfolobus acidocaldarius]ALU31389.1 aldehyde dehydrogenase [Sulfolobus acidocaldarius]WCM34985.1 aldehyde dehydrogenase family protein [Sulfolobus acidocaldarius DSM 639]
MIEVKSIINGEERRSDEYIYRECPYNIDTSVTKINVAKESDVEEAIDVAREFFDKDKNGWVSNYKARDKVLFRIAEKIRGEIQTLSRLLVEEIGMPIRQARVQVNAAADVFEYYAGFGSKIYDTSKFLPSKDMVQIIKEPVGVVGLITPWNFPLTQSARKLAPAITVGCTIVWKPATYAAGISYQLAKIILSSGVPKGALNVIFDPGEKVGAQIVKSKKIDKISFTGETNTGKWIMSEASKDLKRVSLELGGKDPIILFSDSDLKNAIKGAIFGALRNAGQACGATSRLLVEESIAEKVEMAVSNEIKKLKLGNPLQEDTDIGPVVSKPQEDKVIDYIETGIKEGYKLLVGGRKVTDGEFQRGYFIEPTVFSDVDNKSKIAQEEIFGPVLVIIYFKDEEEAISLANDVIYGLTASVWTNDYKKAIRVSRELRVGTVWINDVYTQPSEGLWGGYKQSGIGRELGIQGIEDFLETKMLYTNLSGSYPHFKQVVKD